MRISTVTLVALLLVALLSSTVVAADDEKALSLRVFKKLSAIDRLTNQKHYTKAQTKLDALLRNLPNEAADRAYIYHSQARLLLYLDQLSEARNFFLLSYKEKALDAKTTADLAQMLGSLAMNAGDYVQAVRFFNEYVNSTQSVSKHVYLSLATAFYQQKEYAQAVDPLLHARDNFSPDKSVMTMLFSVYYEMKALRKAASALERIIQYWPEDGKYWSQLASVYLERKQFNDALEIMQLALSRGVIEKESELMQFVYALYEKGLPYKAARALDSGFANGLVSKTHKNYALLATLYVDAREDSAALEAFKRSAKRAKNGSDDLYISQIYYDKKEFEQSAQHVTLALTKGLEQPGNAYMLLASIYTELKQTKKARQYLLKAKEYKNTRKSANQWLKSLSVIAR